MENGNSRRQLCALVVISFKRAALCIHSLKDTIRSSLVLHVHVMVKAIDDRGHWETRGFRVTVANSLAGVVPYLNYYRSLKAGESQL